jgi:hypothetical protein
MRGNSLAIRLEKTPEYKGILPAGQVFSAGSARTAANLVIRRAVD